MLTCLRSLIFLIVLSALPAWGQAYGPYVAEVQRVIDGDTFEAQVHIWPHMVASIHVRVRGTGLRATPGHVFAVAVSCGPKSPRLTESQIREVLNLK